VASPKLRGLVSGDRRTLLDGQSATMIDIDFETPRALLVVVQLAIPGTTGQAAATVTIRSGVERATLNVDKLDTIGMTRVVLARSLQVNVANDAANSVNGYANQPQIDARAVVIPIDISASPDIFGSNSLGVSTDVDPLAGVPSMLRGAVAASVADVVLAAAGAEGVCIYNNSASANLYVGLGTAATLTDFTVKIGPGQYYETPFGWNGAVHGIWDAAVGSCMVTRILS
jgi:hypothetical protein